MDKPFKENMSSSSDNAWNSIIIISLIYCATILIYQCHNVPDSVLIQQEKTKSHKDSLDFIMRTKNADKFCLNDNNNREVGCWNSYVEYIHQSCMLNVSRGDYNECIKTSLSELDSNKINFVSRKR